jgi:hypothetical protein
MPDPMIHLQKTLCAMLWIALLNGNSTVAKAIREDIEYMENQ